MCKQSLSEIFGAVSKMLSTPLEKSWICSFFKCLKNNNEFYGKFWQLLALFIPLKSTINTKTDFRQFQGNGTPYPRQFYKVYISHCNFKKRKHEKLVIIIAVCRKPGTDPTEKKRKKRKRKGKLPKNYDPSVPVDPERWLPRHERSGFRKKRDRRNRDAAMKGTQGAAAGASDL